jgi:hypothetical protein
MIRSEKKLKELAALLNNDNLREIKKAIVTLREEISFEGAIGLLTAFYDRTDDSAIRKTIEGFMNDLKDQDVCEEVITEIRKIWKSDTTSMLVSSCWQSGLDYSDYSSDMVNVFLRSDYVTAIECLTVIEESVYKMEREKKDEILKVIKESPVSEENQIRALTLELIALLES